MSKWNTILRWASQPLTSPGAIGRSIKSATLGAGVGYVGWEALVNDKPVIQTVGDLAVGPTANAALKDTVEGTASGVVQVAGSVRDAVGDVAQATQNMNLQTPSMSWGGAGDFMSNLTDGHTEDMFGNLFTNIFNGNVSPMSMLGLVGAGFLLFGRFGWMGKIAGLILGMMLIGNNSKAVEKTPQLTPTPQVETELPYNTRPQIRR